MIDQTPTTLPRILVVDLETTGLSPNAHSIVEFGAVWLTGGEGRWEKNCRMWHGAQWDPAAAQVNGLSKVRCSDPELRSESVVLGEFLDWTKGSSDEPIMLAGLNTTFDRGFILAAAKRAGLQCSWIFRYRVLDLHTLAVAYALAEGLDVPNRGLYTDEIYSILGLAPEPKPHRALTGATKEAEAFRMLLKLEGGAE